MPSVVLPLSAVEETDEEKVARWVWAWEAAKAAHKKEEDEKKKAEEEAKKAAKKAEDEERRWYAQEALRQHGYKPLPGTLVWPTVRPY